MKGLVSIFDIRPHTWALKLGVLGYALVSPGGSLSISKSPYDVIESGEELPHEPVSGSCNR
jgi:hypothetical protein